MTTPNETHLPCDRREILGHAAYSEYRRQTEIYAGQMQEWLNLPEGVKTEWRNVGEAVADAVSPAPPALTGGDAELAEWNAKANDLALALEVANDHITALSAQVAELSETVELLTACKDVAGDRIAELERDKAQAECYILCLEEQIGSTPLAYAKANYTAAMKPPIVREDV